MLNVNTSCNVEREYSVSENWLYCAIWSFTIPAIESGWNWSQSETLFGIWCSGQNPASEYWPAVCVKE